MNHQYGENANFDQMIFDIFTTAFEGGLQGWAEDDWYHWAMRDAEGNAIADDLQGFYGGFTDEDGNEWKVNRDAMVQGWELAVKHSRRIDWQCGYSPADVEAEGEYEDYDFVAIDAANLIQFAVGCVYSTNGPHPLAEDDSLFGMPVYG